MSTASTRIDHLAIARETITSRRTWPVEPQFDPAERWYHRLDHTDEYEIWLLTWLPGQGTDLHDHGGSAGAFAVMSGRLNELTVSGPAATPTVFESELVTGSGRRFGEHHVHRVTNQGDRPAVSVHVYGPALTTMTRYVLDDAGLNVAAVDLAGAQW